MRRPPKLTIPTVVVLFLIVACLLATGAIAATTVHRRASSTDAAGSNTWHGAELTRPAPRPEFVLTDTEGRRFDFQKETNGKLTVLLFGYLSCPDVCPIQVGTIAAAIRRAGGVEPTVVFVTADPARDTPPRLREWLDNFNPRFIGLTGTHAEVELAQQRAGVVVAVAGPVAPDGAYAVGHSTQAMVFTADDLSHVVYPYGTRQDDWVADLPRLAAITKAGTS